MELPKFKIEYVDGDTFVGESLAGDWNKVNKPIKSMSFTYGGISVFLADFESYNHLIEKASTFQKNQAHITKYLIMGRLKTKTYIFEYDLWLNKSIKKIVDIGQEYGHWEETQEMISKDNWKTAEFKKVFIGQEVKGWKNGVTEGTPKFRHGKL